jgi:ribose 5-phosphate isomerase
VFLLDSSNSVGRFGFRTAKWFATNLLNYFSVFPAKTRVAVASYNGNVEVDFDFKRYVNKECVEREIKNIGYVSWLKIIIK